MSKGGGNTTTVQKADPWKPLQPYLLDMLQQQGALAQNYAPLYHPESKVAPMSPYSQGAIAEMANFGNSPYYQGGLGAFQGALSTLGDAQNPYSNPVLGMGYGQMGNLNSYLNKSMTGGNNITPQKAAAGQVLPNYMAMQGPMTGNPYLDAAVNSAQTRTAQNFNEQVLPQISLSSLGSNNFGGSRQGIAEGLAASRLQQQMGDMATQMYGNAYESGQGRALQGAQTQAGLTQQANLQNAAQMLAAAQLNQQQGQYAAGLGTQYLTGGYGNALDAARLQGALVPSYLQSGTMGTDMLSRAGAMDQQYNQAVLDDNVARWMYNQQLPMMMQDWYRQGINSAQGVGGASSTTAPGSSTSPLVGALGGALGGAGLASMGGLFGSAATATAPAVAASPWAWPLVGGAALLGALGNG